MCVLGCLHTHVPHVHTHSEKLELMLYLEGDGNYMGIVFTATASSTRIVMASALYLHIAGAMEEVWERF